MAGKKPPAAPLPSAVLAESEADRAAARARALIVEAMRTPPPADPAAAAAAAAEETRRRRGEFEERVERYPRWDEIELRLRHRWPPAQVIRWFTETHPAEALPCARTLNKYVQGRPESWFVPALLLDDAARGMAGRRVERRLQRLLVLERQAELISALTMRINRALDTEMKLEGFLLPEVRQNMELLAKMLKAHLDAQIELGVEAAVPRRLDVHEESTRRVFHDVFQFLPSDRAAQLRALEAKVDRGELDLGDFYEQVGTAFTFEQEMRTRALPPMPGKGKRGP